MPARCGENCGWCGACTAIWEREPEDDVEPDLDEEDDAIRNQLAEESSAKY